MRCLCQWHQRQSPTTALHRPKMRHSIALFSEHKTHLIGNFYTLLRERIKARESICLIFHNEFALRQTSIRALLVIRFTHIKRNLGRNQEKARLLGLNDGIGEQISAIFIIASHHYFLSVLSKGALTHHAQHPQKEQTEKDSLFHIVLIVCVKLQHSRENAPIANDKLCKLEQISPFS